MNKTLFFLLFFILSSHYVFADNIPNIIFTKAEILNKYTTRIPFKLIDHLIVIEAELLNKKGNFIIDTGSETLILNKVHFPVQYGHNKKDEKTYGINRYIDNPIEKKLDKFKIQHFTLNNKMCDVISLSHIEKSKKIHLLGIIGYSILKDYEVFIDLHLNQITLSKVDKYGNKLDSNVYLEKIIDSVQFKLKKHTIVLSCLVQDQPVKFGLDTGAEFNQINKNAGKKVLKHFQPKKRVTLIGAGNGKVEVLVGHLHRVKLSKSQYFGPMNTVLTNLSKMNEAFGTKLDGVLGYDFFKYKRTIINYQKEKLYFINYPIYRQ